MPRATIVLLHGEVARPERLAYTSARLGSEGYHVVIPDLSGDAYTGGGRRFKTALAELDARIDAETESGGLPLVLLGLGTGASLALHHAISDGEQLCGLILAAPLAQEPDGPWKRVLSRLGGTLLPDAQPMTLDPQVAARDSRTVVDWIVDPMTRLGPINASSGAEQARRDARIMDGVDTITLPTLLLWGRGEGLTPPGGAEHLLGTLTHAELTRTSFDSPYHELLTGPTRDAVLDTTVAWLAAHV